ncbi:MULTISPECIES: ABC transporter ATP-binding protein [Geobacillus]|uniref:ABC transporter ATP-binding protein n=4 Tax=Geobacillus TaxID=129337 RepID=A0A226Q3U6_9BACL|nr:MULTISPECIES: ABC transporter ATP-binding protein [Geobacillus]AST00715.1 ABC transporter ATP-binding protein [Geobacillus thermocatenulatus]AWO74094.1 ABC transporter ATP-binding protein [Geobacillus thermoleovorans]KLR75052.1 ABC transporter ATP-binding protein [Geobacillus sp. T6]MBW7644519.1 ABC transporter ATP-binding protein/permease [Geobacillus thermoleovorans]MED3667655.1 ABC transporter ATP-binding protein [Geobacillus kaustophilus]
MNIKEYDDHVTIKDIVKSIRIVPKTLVLIKNVDKQSFFIIIFLSLLMGGAPIVTLLGSQNLLNAIGSQNIHIIISALIFYISAVLLSEIISSFMEYYQNKFQTLINYKLNLQIMDKCTRLSLQHFEDAEVYDMLQRVQNETPYKPFEVFLSILGAISAIVTFFSSMMILIHWKPWVLIILIFIPLVFSFYFFKIGQREFNVSWLRAPEKRKSWYLSYLMTRDNTFKEVKIYNLAGYILNKFKEINKTFVEQDIHLFKRRTVFTFIFELVEQICINTVLVIIIISALAGEILIGHVVGLIQALNLISSNSKKILNIIHSLYKNNLYINQLFEFLGLDEEVLDKGDRFVSGIDKIENIKIRNLTFRYPTKPKVVLKNINLDINKGERIAIVGANGSGKSTLIKLLLKLYEHDEDSIFYNGVSINDLDTEQLRKNIAVLFQDFVKYELKLRENVGFGDITRIDRDGELKQAMERARVNFIEDLDTQLGLWFVDGVQLSGGQWQKVAIARALFRDASVYILDEPSSALDPISEKEVIDMFINMTKDKIGIFISHRLSTAKLADKIVVMNDGEIVGIGTHWELLATNELYRRMYELEALKNEEEYEHLNESAGL